MHIIDKLSYSSKIASNSAREKIIFCMPPLFFCLLTSSYILYTIVFAVMSYSTLKYSALNIKQYLKLILLPGSFILLGLITIIFNISNVGIGDVLFTFNILNIDIYASENGVLLAINILLRSLACISCFYFLILNTPMNNLFSYLQKLKVPDLLITLTELVYRFSFVLLGELERIRTAQLSRLGYLNIKNGINATAQILVMTFERALNRANNIDIVLQSRCFDGAFNVISTTENTSNLLKVNTIILNGGLIIFLIVEVYFKWIY